MRLIKMFGLAALSAVAAMAFIGASSASATFDTAICSEASSTLACPTAKLVKHVHFIDTKAILLTDVLDVTCNALFLGDVLNAGLLATAPEPLKIFGEFTYTACNNGCTAKEAGTAGGHILVLKTAADLGVVEGDEFEVRVICLGLIECTYTGEGLKGHALSATSTTNGQVTSHNESVAHLPAGILDICPDTGELDALFESLTKQWIRS